MEVSERAFGGRYFVVAVTAIVIAILMWFVSDRLDKEMVNAERAQFELRLAELRSTVLLMQASQIAQNNMAAAAQYIGSNPMRLMKENQRGYLGEKRFSRLTQAEKDRLAGNWIFDLDQQAMRYFPKSPEVLNEYSQDVSGDSLQFKVVGLWSDEGAQKKLIGLRLSDSINPLSGR